GSVGSPHVRVGHFQTPNTTKPVANATGFFRLTAIEIITRKWGNKSPNVVRLKTMWRSINVPDNIDTSVILGGRRGQRLRLLYQLK
ncbi:hypothetical protein, partial [Shewanella algidipiscicola]|uniref:hypothetical protein n=1 Tax=Shewanella algidipiscicola TaxID=614070 RepID=UPI001B877CFD